MEFETSINISPEEMSVSEIEEYLEGRVKDDHDYVDITRISLEDVKYIITAICTIKRNKLLIDKETAKIVINELIDDLF